MAKKWGEGLDKWLKVKVSSVRAEVQGPRTHINAEWAWWPASEQGGGIPQSNLASKHGHIESSHDSGKLGLTGILHL